MVNTELCHGVNVPRSKCLCNVVLLSVASLEVFRSEKDALAVALQAFVL